MTAREYAEIVVSEMNDEDIAGITQQGSAEHWQDGIGMMLTGGEGFEASDVVREIESLLDVHRGETRSIPQPDETMAQALRDLAVEWQDQHLVQLCDRALVQGDPEAVADCKRIFHDAFALLRGHRGEL